MTQTYGPDRIREMNSLAVLAHLRAIEDTTSSQIAAATGLSRTSVNATITDLERLGWVQSLPPASPPTGRPAKRYRFRSESGFVLGIDIGANRIATSLTDLCGEEKCSEETELAPSSAAPRRMEAVQHTISHTLEKNPSYRDDLALISVAVTGPVDEAGRMPFGGPLPGWESVPMVQELQARYKRPVTVENDCKCALDAESHLGQAQDVSSAVYIMAGARIGASFMIDGKVCRGSAGAAGEIGALPHLNWYKTPAHFFTHSQLPADLSHRSAARWVCDRMRDGDAEATRIVKEFARDLALGAAALILTIDPEVLILGGGISASADLWKDEFSSRLEELTIHMPEIRVSQLGGRGVVQGAVCRGIDQITAHACGEQLLPASEVIQIVS